MKKAFDSISGFDSVKAKLKRLVEVGRVPQSLLFSGPESAPKKEIAVAFARLVLGREEETHPDLHLYVPEGKVSMHTISSMRQFSDDVYLAPFEAEKKVFILLEADRMLPVSANALLKTFEEPSLDSVIILVSSHPSHLLPTILSRCQQIRVDQGEIEERSALSKEPFYKELLDAVAGGALASYARVLAFVDQLAAHIDAEYEELEGSLRSSLIEERSKQLTALQKESLNKEIDGTVALQKKARIKELLIILQSWYRDVQLLKVNGSRKLLMNPSFEEMLVKAAGARGKEAVSLSDVEQAVRDALLALERSTSSRICLENFFLQLMKC